MHPWPDCVTEFNQKRDGKPSFWRGKPSRYPKPLQRIGLQPARKARRHTKHTPRPPPKRQRIHVISTPGFFHPLYPRAFSRLRPPAVAACRRAPGLRFKPRSLPVSPSTLVQ
jgi:hypothetical protein